MHPCAVGRGKKFMSSREQLWSVMVCRSPVGRAQHFGWKIRIPVKRISTWITMLLRQRIHRVLTDLQVASLTCQDGWLLFQFLVWMLPGLYSQAWWTKNRRVVHLQVEGACYQIRFVDQTRVRSRMAVETWLTFTEVGWQTQTSK